MDHLPHSAPYIDAERDFWWNPDFLELTARRLEFAQVGTVLDVGCGPGHWSRALATVLPPTARVTGLEPEPAWREQAMEQTRALGPRFAFVAGRAEAMPFADDSFDLVTCQTVLLHLADPEAALREMRRVTKPGGLVLAVEPNNTALVFDTVSMDEPVEALTARVEFHLRCERGRRLRGLGFSSFGDVGAGYFARAGLRAIRVYQSDRTQTLVPPYDTPAEQAMLEQLRTWAEPAVSAWYQEDHRRCYLAGGGTEAAFAEHWRAHEAAQRAVLAAIEAGTYAASGGTLFYLLAGRK